MTILCGTDFSKSSSEAALAACAIAQRLGLPLKLVHVIDDGASMLAPGSQTESLRRSLQARLREEAETLKEQMGVEIEPVVVSGVPGEELVKIARDTPASLVVVSSMGAKKPARWLVGSVAESVAQGSPVPVLVVRNAARIAAWAREGSSLIVMVGVSPDAASKRALRWAAGLRAIGPCSLTIVQVVRPYAEQARFGIVEAAASTDLEPVVHAALSRDLRDWAGDAAGVGETAYRVFPGWGRVDGHLAELATASSSDLLVVGTHRRAGLARLWQGSVSRGVIQYAESNAACVPPTVEAGAEAASDLAGFRSVLIATDFSALGNRAVRCGYRLMREGGTAHLLHVMRNDSSAAHAEAEARLRALVPPDAASHGIATELHVLREEQAADGICYAAARFGIDVICMGTHGRSELGGLLNGSQAQEVIHRSSQPVLLIKPEPKGP